MKGRAIAHRPFAPGLEIIDYSTTMNQIARHRDHLQRSLPGPAWHGPALLELLDDVSVDEAYARPLAGMHSIAEISAHCLAWLEEVTQRLRGEPVGLPARGDWPDLEQPSAAGWEALRHALEAAGAALDAALAGCSAELLLEQVGGAAYDPPSGSGVSYDVMLAGLAQHHAYHGGQISLLKLVLRRSTSSPGAPPRA